MSGNCDFKARFGEDCDSKRLFQLFVGLLLPLLNAFSFWAPSFPLRVISFQILLFFRTLFLKGSRIKLFVVLKHSIINLLRGNGCRSWLGT